MSQTLQGEGSTAQCQMPNLVFAQDTHFGSRQKLYIVIALSQRKQSQIMETVGQVHCHDQPFPTWNLLRHALSKVLFAEPGRLKLKSTMELHQKDYLLFERVFDDGSTNTPSAAIATESILEVDFGTQSDHFTWLGYWKTARPVVVGLVQNSLENLARLGEPDHSQPDVRYRDGTTKAQGTTDKKT